MKTHWSANQSELKGMACCRFHDDRTPSMAIYENKRDDHTFYTYHCFGCNAHGMVPRNELNSWLSQAVRLDDSVREERVYRGASGWKGTWECTSAWECQKGQYAEMTDFLADRTIHLLVADKAGIRYNPTSNSLWWECKRSDGGVQALQCRYVHPTGGKKILTYPVSTEDTAYPKHAVLLGHRPISLIISESFLDGVALWGATEQHIITTLSSNFNQAHVGLINMFMGKRSLSQVLLAYDMDTAGKKAETHMDRFLRALGYEVIRMSQYLKEEEAHCSTILKPYHREYLSKVRGLLR